MVDITRWYFDWRSGNYWLIANNANDSLIIRMKQWQMKKTDIRLKFTTKNEYFDTIFYYKSRIFWKRFFLYVLEKYNFWWKEKEIFLFIRTIPTFYFVANEGTMLCCRNEHIRTSNENCSTIRFKIHTNFELKSQFLLE